MAVPNSMQDLATLASSNSPAGSEAIGNSLDNYLRAHAAIESAKPLSFDVEGA